MPTLTEEEQLRLQQAQLLLEYMKKALKPTEKSIPGLNVEHLNLNTGIGFVALIIMAQNAVIINAIEGKDEEGNGGGD